MGTILWAFCSLYYQQTTASLRYLCLLLIILPIFRPLNSVIIKFYLRRNFDKNLYASPRDRGDNLNKKGGYDKMSGNGEGRGRDIEVAAAGVKPYIN